MARIQISSILSRPPGPRSGSGKGDERTGRGRGREGETDTRISRGLFTHGDEILVSVSPVNSKLRVVGVVALYHRRKWFRVVNPVIFG